MAALPVSSPEQLPEQLSLPLRKLLLRPYLRTGQPAALLLTCSTFGVYLAEKLLGLAAAEELLRWSPTSVPVAQLLTHITLRHPWQYRPDPRALAWLQQQERAAKATEQ